LSPATTAERLFIGAQSYLSTSWKHAFDFRVRPRNYMNADQLSYTPGGSGTGVGRRLNGPDIAADKDRYIARSDVFLPDQLNVRGLHHRIRGLYGADESFGLDHPECF
jgi:hypothetical protein